VNLKVVFEDNHLLVVQKPAGLLVQGDATGETHLLHLAETYRIEREGKPGKAFVGLVHRLDRPVSGLVILAKTSKAAARLSEQFRTRQVLKIYFAAVEITSPRVSMPPLNQVLMWQDHLDRPGVSSDKNARARGGKGQLCQTECRLREQTRTVALVELHPVTGRKHQLRAQTSIRGLPIVGDRRYGSSQHFPEGIALHAAGLRFEHPTRRVPVELRSLPPDTWNRFPFQRESYRIDFDNYPNRKRDAAESNFSSDEDEED